MLYILLILLGNILYSTSDLKRENVDFFNNAQNRQTDSVLLIVEKMFFFTKLITFHISLFTLKQSINLMFFLYYLDVHLHVDTFVYKYSVYIHKYQRYGSTCTSFVILSLGKLSKPCALQQILLRIFCFLCQVSVCFYSFFNRQSKHTITFCSFFP